MNGVIIIDKPQGFTSFDVIAVMRRLCAQRKIGHTGTLDPMATGVLPLLLGSATRAQAQIPDSDKEYVAQFQLGITTDTLDSTGKTLTQKPYTGIGRQQILQVCAQFEGKIMQTPPMYSAVQKDGQRLYDLARKGVTVERAPRPVAIRALSLQDYREKEGTGTIRVSCSKGTYIRSLVDDMGAALGCGAVLTGLRRTGACGFTLEQAATLEQMRALAQQGLAAQRLLPTEHLFLCYRAITVTERQATRFKNGGALDLARTSLHHEDCPDGSLFRIKDAQGVFLGLGVIRKAREQLAVWKLFCTRE